MCSTTITTPNCPIHHQPLSKIHNGPNKPHRLVCTQCALIRTQVWRKQYRSRYIWNSFLHRVKRKFGINVSRSLQWTTHGYPWITKLIDERKQLLMENVNVNDLTLTWKIGASMIDQNNIELIERCNARRRCKPREKVQEAKVLIVSGIMKMEE